MKKVGIKIIILYLPAAAPPKENILHCLILSYFSFEDLAVKGKVEEKCLTIIVTGLKATGL